MKNLICSLPFMLIGSFAFANTPDNTVTGKNQIESLQTTDIVKDLNYQAMGCSSNKTTITTTQRDGRSKVVTNTTVKYDTPVDLSIKINNKNIPEKIVCVATCSRVIGGVTYTAEAGNWFSTCEGAARRCERKLDKLNTLD
jgi:hypothetical protein